MARNSQKTNNGMSGPGWGTFWQSSRSTIVSAVIAILVIGGLFVLFNALPANQPAKPTEETKQEQQKQEEQNKTTEKKDQAKQEQTKLPTSYRVVRGDSLWKISTHFYGSGYNWVLISQANKLANPNVIHTGNVLTVPKATTQARTYTVNRGDSLWTISQKFYGTGYDWWKIRDANAGKIGTLANGRPLITPGQVLVVP